MKSKKGMNTMEVLIGAILIALILFISISILFKQIKGPNSGIQDEINLVGSDHDKDGFNDKIDSCPCQAGEKDNSGCPYNYKEADKDNSCLTKQ